MTTHIMTNLEALDIVIQIAEEHLSPGEEYPVTFVHSVERQQIAVAKVVRLHTTLSRIRDELAEIERIGNLQEVLANAAFDLCRKEQDKERGDANGSIDTTARHIT